MNNPSGRSRLICPADRRHRQCVSSRLAASGVIRDENSGTNLAPAALADAQEEDGARDGRGDALPPRNADRTKPVVRDGGGRGALYRPATIRQSNLVEGGKPRDVEFEVYRDADARPALWRPNVDEESRLHSCGGEHTRARHWSEHRDLQCGECDPASATSVQRPGPDCDGVGNQSWRIRLARQNGIFCAKLPGLSTTEPGLRANGGFP